MWNITICDDEKQTCIQLKKYIEQYIEETGNEFFISECYSAEELLKTNISNTDLILLDISMSGMTGMDAAKIIRNTNKEVLIVFITTMVNYAIEGYKVHAYGFLRKPLSYALFKMQMIDVTHVLKSRISTSITLTINGHPNTINAQDLIYFEIMGHQVRIETLNGSFDYYGTLSEIEEKLSDQSFFRCHRSFLINLAHIKIINSDSIETKTGCIIPLSKYKRKELLTEYSKYIQSIV